MSEGATTRWRRTIAVVDRTLPTGGPRRYLLAYAAVLLALPGLVPGALVAFAGRGCASLDCLLVGVTAVGVALPCVLALIVWSARRLGLGSAWALLTTAGLTVLSVTTMLGFTLGDRLPLVVLAAVALPAASAWATPPDWPWSVRLVRIVTLATGIAVVVASYQATL